MGGTSMIRNRLKIKHICNEYIAAFGTFTLVCVLIPGSSYNEQQVLLCLSICWCGDQTINRFESTGSANERG